MRGDDMPRRNQRREGGQVSKRTFSSRGAIVNGDGLHWRPDLEKLVEPSGRCGGRPDGKLRFVGEDVADAALKQAQRRRNWQNNPHAEKRYYWCSKCSTDLEQSYHLTSADYPGGNNE
jgi:hypothetical protein